MVSKEGGNGTADPEKGTYGVTMPAVTPLENANVMPGGTRNTAGGKVQQAGFQDALKSIQPGDVMTVHQKPCARQSYMTGMGMGAVVGVLQSIRGLPILRSCNWAVGAFCFGSFAMYEFCQWNRTLEQQGVRRAVEVVERKRAEKKAAAMEARDAKFVEDGKHAK